MRLSGQILAPNSHLPWNSGCLSFTSNPGRHLYEQRNALRFFSKSRSSWRKTKSLTRGKVRERREPFPKVQVGSDVRSSTKNPEDSEAHRKLNKSIIQTLSVLADKAPGTEFSTFARDVAKRLQRGNMKSGDEFYHFMARLRRENMEGGGVELVTQIKYALHEHLANQRARQVSFEDQAELADLRHPLEWYPGTRALQRTIHLHVGPTNSGKTYHALKRLEQAKTGIYAGPLRLLAYEVYTRLNDQGKKCHLITGDDKRINEEASDDTESMISCTVEMVPVNTTVDVGVIDEIQMIGHPDRGWAWSQAFFGLRAKELHLCGEARTEPLIRELAAAMGDKLVLHHYERLSPLKLAARSLNGDLTRLKKGDCLVVFSRKEIHYMKREIEKRTGRRVAIVYGSLPPETRARQASLFNDPDNDYDYLVATDAIGMGLNLDIKRIVFEATSKYNGTTHVRIPVPELKQIAGRAGRYRIAPPAKLAPNSAQSMGNNSDDGSLVKLPSIPLKRPSSPTVGLVTTLEIWDFRHIQRAMNTEAEPVMAAGILPPSSVVVKFAAYFSPDTPFSYILKRLHQTSSLHPRYFLCDLKDHTHVADIIEPVRNLTIQDRIIFCASPVGQRDPEFDSIVVSFAQCVANSKEVSSNLLDIPTLQLEILDQEMATDRDYMYKLEGLHKALILYIWLSYRFVGVFAFQSMAVYLKGIVEEKINKALEQSTSNRLARLKSLRQLAMLEELGQAIDSGEHVKGTTVSPVNRAFANGLRFDLRFGGRDAVEPEGTLDDEPPSELGDNDIGNNGAPAPEPIFDWQQTPQIVDHAQVAKDRTELTVGNSN